MRCCQCCSSSPWHRADLISKLPGRIRRDFSCFLCRVASRTKFFETASRRTGRFRVESSSPAAHGAPSEAEPAQTAPAPGLPCLVLTNSRWGSAKMLKLNKEHKA
ncbi:hypothetical protein EK904_002065 [Melospiza melodia maxima]|nr:hypothetical protein EK904_002065 [Melospiza melodia maxima]